MRFVWLTGKVLVATFSNYLPAVQKAARLDYSEREHRLNSEMLGSNTSEDPNACQSEPNVHKFLSNKMSNTSCCCCYCCAIDFKQSCFFKICEAIKFENLAGKTKEPNFRGTVRINLSSILIFHRLSIIGEANHLKLFMI